MRNRLVGKSTFNDTVPIHENLEERNLMGINDEIKAWTA